MLCRTTDFIQNMDEYISRQGHLILTCKVLISNGFRHNFGKTVLFIKWIVFIDNNFIYNILRIFFISMINAFAKTYFVFFSKFNELPFITKYELMRFCCIKHKIISKLGEVSLSSQKSIFLCLILNQVMFNQPVLIEAFVFTAKGSAKKAYLG